MSSVQHMSSTTRTAVLATCCPGSRLGREFESGLGTHKEPRAQWRGMKRRLAADFIVLLHSVLVLSKLATPLESG